MRRVKKGVDMYKIIEQLCTERGITITSMCKNAGVSRASLSDLKGGRKQGLSAGTLAKIATYFEVSVDYLLKGSDVLSQEDLKKGTSCPIRHKNDLCLAYGNDCKEVNSEICKALQVAYQIGYEESVSDVTSDILRALNETMEKRIKKG